MAYFDVTDERKIVHIEDLKKGLVLYSMVFGQPHQEELLSFLQNSLWEKIQMSCLISNLIGAEAKLAVTNIVLSFL